MSPTIRTTAQALEDGLARLDAAAPTAAARRAAWRGESPASYMSKKSRDALDGRLARLSVNFPRLVVSALAERMRLSGLELEDASDDDRGRVWTLFNQAQGLEVAELAHTDRLLYGSSYVTCWVDSSGSPALTVDTPLTMTHLEDPVTREVLAAVRRWTTRGQSYAAVYTPDEISLFEGSGHTITMGTAELVRREPNPLDLVPVVPLVRRSSASDDATGASAVDDVLPLSDAAAKLLQDALVSSEYYARPRRWVTGLEIEEDEDGNIIDPFGESRLLQSESPDTKFGQLDAGRLDGYGDLMATVTQSIGALTGLPAHYLGLHGDQPASAEAMRSAEAQLVQRASSEIRAVDREWGLVAELIAALADGRAARPNAPAVVSWHAPETSTPAMDADAAAKLRGIGVPLEAVLEDRLGYGPDAARRLAEQARTELVLSSFGRANG